MESRKNASTAVATPRRRTVLQIGALSALGLTVEGWFRQRAARAESDPAARSPATSCILLWLDGGPSHLDTFDPKPEAPREVRGPFAAIDTRVDGVRFCEHLRETARIADRLAIVRSVTSTLGEHNFGSHYLLTGYKPTPTLTYPGYGSVVAASRPDDDVLPPHIAVGDRLNPFAGRGYLPRSTAPFVVPGDPARRDFRVRDLELHDGLDLSRLRQRREFLADFDRLRREIDEHADEISRAGDSYARAFDLVASSRARQAFDLEQESRAVRDRYGRRTLGQSCLIARRLVERGVPFVTVTDRGWDTHNELTRRLQEGYTGGSVGKVPVLDRALAALVSDLEERGLLESTLVLALGEFGRTPKLNTRGGRDHWPRVFSVALAGGGVRGGQVIGASDAHGESPAERPVSPADLARSVFRLLDVDPDHEFYTADGRPVRVNAGGRVVGELLA